MNASHERSQHRAASYVNTLYGLWGILKQGAAGSSGPGLVELHAHIDVETAVVGEEQFTLYRETLALPSESRSRSEPGPTPRD